MMSAQPWIETAEQDPDETESQSRRAYRLIEEMIVTLELPPGSRVSETLLSRKLGLGRTPIREALQRLSIEGTVHVIPRSGVVVSEIDIEDQLGMIEVRRGLENVMAGRAARLATSAQREGFRAIAERFATSALALDGASFIHADREFNALVAECAASKYAAHAIGPIEAQTRRFWFLHFQRFGDLKRVCKLHADVALRIADGDEAGARRRSDKLMDYVEAYTRRTLLSLRG
jgi:DNA-binding GntR family transcriptional regulator